MSAASSSSVAVFGWTGRSMAGRGLVVKQNLTTTKWRLQSSTHKRSFRTEANPFNCDYNPSQTSICGSHHRYTTSECREMLPHPHTSERHLTPQLHTPHQFVRRGWPDGMSGMALTSNDQHVCQDGRLQSDQFGPDGCLLRAHQYVIFRKVGKAHNRRVNGH